MRKSGIFIILLLLIIAAETWALYYHTKHPSPVQYQLASAEYELPQPDLSGIKPFLFENGWAEDINNELDKIQAIIDNSLNDDFTQSLSKYSARRKRIMQIRRERQKGLEEYRERLAREAHQIKGEYLGNNLCSVNGKEGTCEDGVYKLDNHCIACYAGLCAGTACADKPAQPQTPQEQTAEPTPQPEVKSVVKPTEAPQETEEETAPQKQEIAQPQPFKPDGKKALIAVVIDDVGLSVPFTNQISQIQKPITVAFLPYGASDKKQVQKLKNAGFEVMLHAPMLPKVPADLAPVTLSPKMSKQEIQDKFKTMLDRFAGTDMVGTNNHMGSAFTEDKAAMSAVAEILKKENMFFLDSMTTSKSVAKSVCREYGVPYISRDVFLDNEKNYDKIMKQFAAAERIAQKRGYAVAIGHPYKQTLQALKDWEKAADKHNIEIVPLSYLVRKTN